jgi:hypothetical protein
MSLRAPIRKSRVASDSVARDRSRRVHGIQSVRKLVDVDQVGNLSDEYENTGLFYPDADEDTHDDFGDPIYIYIYRGWVYLGGIYVLDGVWG